MAGIYAVGETKVRPGAYFNIQKRDEPAPVSYDGTVGILFHSDWGPLNEAVELNARDGYEQLYGNGGTTDAIGLAIEGGAVTCICCRIGKDGAKATTTLKTKTESTDAVKLTAKYVGAKPFTVTIKDRLANPESREAVIYSGTKELEHIRFTKGGDECVSLVSAMRSSAYFDAELVESASGELAAVVQQEVSGGSDPTSTVQEYSDGFAVLEPYYMNTICVDTDQTNVHNLLYSFLDRIFDSGQFGIGVIAEKHAVDLEDRIAHAAAFNSEKMVYVLNADVNSSTYGKIDGYQTAAKIAGMISSVKSNTSLTHTVVEKFTSLNEPLTPTEMTNAELSGCLVLSVNKAKNVWIDNAINTLITPADNQDNGWKKIRRTKTRYELLTRMNEVADNLIGNVDNDTNGRATVVSQLNAVGSAMIDEGKLVACSVTESATNAAVGDSAWFDIDVIDKDSIEHLYMQFTFRFNTQEE